VHRRDTFRAETHHDRPHDGKVKKGKIGPAKLNSVLDEVLGDATA